MWAHVNQYEDRDAIREEYMRSGANYDILTGDKVHDLTDEAFENNVKILRQVLQKRRERNFGYFDE